MRARVPSTVVAALVAAGILTGTGFAGVAVVRRHPADKAAPAFTPPPQANVARTTAVTTVAPLRHLVQPDLFVSAARPLARPLLNKLRHVERAKSALAIDIGFVRVNGRRATAVAANLSTLRGYTPPPTAASDLLWQNLANGDVAVSYTFAKAMRLVVGQQVVLGKQSVRLGAIADIGLPKVSVVMSPETGARVHLKPGAGVLLSAPGRSADTLASNARDLLGRKATIVTMNDNDGSSSSGKPKTYMELYRAAARTCSGLSWTILAAIGQVESGHGRNVGPSPKGALGPMQFMPATWAVCGMDADGDKKADIMDPYDAVYSAAAYLCYYSPGSSLANLKRAVFAYNHADWYVDEVLALAKLYG